METLAAFYPFVVKGLHWSPVDSSNNGPVVRHFDGFFCAIAGEQTM